MGILKGVLTGLFIISVVMAWAVLIYKLCEVLQQWERVMTYGW